MRERLTYWKCPACHGLGRVAYGPHVEPCFSCDGTGNGLVDGRAAAHRRNIERLEQAEQSEESVELAQGIVDQAVKRLADARIEMGAAEENLHAARAHLEQLKRAEAAKIPVNRSAQELVGGNPVPSDRSHTELKPNGQQKDYVVLSAEERASGFVRPVRRSYVHVGRPAPASLRDLTEKEKVEYRQWDYVKFEPYGPDRSPLTGRYWTQDDLDRLGGCGVSTKMSEAIAETYARDPGFYGGTFCVGCGKHFPVGANGEFIWDDGSRVGT